MPVIINGQVIDLDKQTTVPLSPVGAWKRALEQLDQAQWSISECSRVIRENEYEALLHGVATFSARAPAVATAELLRRLTEGNISARRWLKDLKPIPPSTVSALLAAWGEGPLPSLLRSPPDWPTTLSMVVELLEIEEWSSEKKRTKSLASLAAQPQFFSAVDEVVSRHVEQVPFVFLELVLARKGSSCAWLEDISNPVTRRRLKRSCVGFGRSDLLARLGSEAPLALPAAEPVAAALAAFLSKKTKRPSLANPASAKTLDALTPPPEVRALWSIANGQKSGVSGFFGDLPFLGTKGSQEAREWMEGWCLGWLRANDELWAEARVRDDEILSDAWFPIAAQDYSMVAVSGVTGRVFTVEKDAPPMTLHARSVTEWLTRLDANGEDEDS